MGFNVVGRRSKTKASWTKVESVGLINLLIKLDLDFLLQFPTPSLLVRQLRKDTSELGEYVFQSVFLALLLEISLIGGIVHQLRDLTSCRKIQPKNETLSSCPSQFYPSRPYRLVQKICMHALTCKAILHLQRSG